MSEPVFKTYAEEIAYKRGFVDGDLFAEQRIIKLLEGEMCEKDGELVECWCGSWLEAIAVIKGENKTNPWTSRPLTEEDEEAYGLKGENK